MNPKRKAAMDRLMSVKTKAELSRILSEMNITDEEREMALMVLSNGWSYTKVSMETGFSVRHVTRKMERIYSKLI